jgi:purine-binding chemotaxis protein CheW
MPRKRHRTDKEGKMASEGELIGKVAAVAADREGKYLTFTLAGEEYGIGILKVK